ncbi:MAG: helix-turn-helix domain-containing protein [Candidatus Omnitrophica bacterium]|jgi:excisionase family DNA binding protein|nr:helix-turn-helix domain-containing protein [Candidatus Omnitrophota bacterium]MDD3275419.1 helix-turn-helix domain-containing protein [Candidatus Omnitrophota bacterium]MDD5077764.1 helix-turn-helix domain-containing protein [Candidatus Omnitrophota bacterium]MDD5724837.1 helix-turn-helix domain-containing protein [Candidatus Omnitrophota bacterium]
MVSVKEIMTAKEVARYLSIHTLTVQKYARAGKIPAFKIGTDWRFHRKYLERWIDRKLTFRPGRKGRAIEGS